MTDDELVNGISWHLDCITLAAGAIDTFRPPADVFQMRMQHSLYLTNLMSAIDMMGENFGNAFQSALNAELSINTFIGAKVLGYLRGLRNGIVHRGIDPTSGSEIIGGIVRAIAPIKVHNRSVNEHYDAPNYLLRNIFCHCEAVAKPIMGRFLEMTFERLSAVKSDDTINFVRRSIASTAHMPGWAKVATLEHLNPAILAEIQAVRVAKLRDQLTTTGWLNAVTEP